MRTELKIALRFIESLLNISTTVVSNEKAIKEFCSQYFFHSMQEYLTPKKFQKFINGLRPNVIYQTSDPLHICFTFIILDEQLVVIGPYSKLIFTEQNCRYLLTQNNMDEVSINDFQLYRNKFPFINEQQLTSSIHTLIEIINNLESSHNIEINTIYFGNTQNPNDELVHNDDAPHPKRYIEFITERYGMEQRFMNEVKEGKYRAAILTLRQLQNDVSHLMRIGTTIENERVSAGIVRTLVRIAAVNAGLPAFTIDLLSSENTIAVKNAKSLEEILKSKENMVITFCKQIKKLHNERYSNLILMAIYYINHQLHQDITIAEIAQELEVSPNYLSTRFRKETGHSPIEYIKKERLLKATQLLTTTTLSVQNIGNCIGISDSNYFIKVFKSEYGLTPLQYRKYYHL